MSDIISSSYQEKQRVSHEMEAGNSPALRFQVVLLVALPFQRLLDVCLFFSSEYNYQQQNVSLFIHLVSNEDMETDINSTRLPA